MLALLPEYGISGWSDIGILLHWLSGAPLTRQQLAELHGHPGLGSAKWRSIFCLCVLAELYRAAGYFAEGIGVLDTISAKDREAFYGPEIHRLEGERRRQLPSADLAEVERCFRTALTLAESRQEKSLELRAAMSLARLWRAQDRRAEARELLAPVYGWFSEGFDLPDLKDAKR